MRDRRLELGLTLDAAAERCDLEARHLQAIEGGATNVTLTTLLRLVAGLDLGLDALLAPLLGPAAPARKRPCESDPAPPESVEGAVGDHVKRLRLRRGWSQRDLAAAAGLSLGLVQSLEGATKSPTIRSLVLVARALGVEPADLLRPGADGAELRTARSPPRVRRRA